MKQPVPVSFARQMSIRETLIAVVLVIAILASAYIPTPPVAYAEGLEPKIEAPSAIVIDAKTGDILWEKNADEKHPIASTTKIMTAIIAIENKSLGETVTAGSDVLGTDGYGFEIPVGEKMRLEDFLYALLLYSANDAAVAVADYVGGSIDVFARMMNIQAKDIGANNTNYVNPHGLPVKGHPSNYSTARDLAKIARYAMKNKTFQNIVATRKRNLSRFGTGKRTIVENRNRLLWSYPAADGVKTGYTKEAGHCLVSSARRGDVQVISVVLGAATSEALFIESASLLEYGFGCFEKKRLLSKGKVYQTVRVGYGQTIDLTAASDIDGYIRRSRDIEIKTTTQSDIKLPVKKGATLGMITVFQSGKPVATVDLVVKQTLKKPTFFQAIDYYIKAAWNAIF
ncbi:MAG: D-alanyl-D-alanine carboxypeptidase [Candidatus Aquicultor secundus]|uniref:serine-type D-Ala-D-Ala carboxypeptidase n=1 Tax=Candidatus Aquicultor secundus TaxID=1973895 RepID=A0A2M7T927_9ACTN|nr:D-alanyl-D-alanine carboxypeptidase family protein [Candidatus Aquicultor secundus]NCO66399.1 D-alanyl-D-alanine carboxypeptidase [Solirubrobacter sp.]PIU26890.1 MAG: D-alanyl-D-alanine carboxypeptidase [Candidatus Aquicultor secundus]PIW22029.1 MAG: D-alanyl-D-alanine carboxypeptidase [Candidatus Aquicultor secundus]PIX52873.1 MAG: D-alanyl-D-alanine carboxypeptidase [Candidatus Aquicultor secundus]PIY41702.1 MAG: D-alanyl-D-alanine carboxypeptidase [Candidatus Aquicultor secundus]